MAKKLKQQYYDMILSNYYLFADIIKIFNKGGQTIEKWTRNKRYELNSFEVLELINKYLKEEGKEVEDLKDLFEN